MRLFTVFFTIQLLATSASAEILKIINIRVGQGDATLIQGPTTAGGNRINVLVDAGDIPDRDGGNILRAVLSRHNVDELDFVVVTHDDADHIGGIVAGGRHGRSFVLGFDDAPGCPGDDDGDGVSDWEVNEEFFVPDPDELGLCDDLVVHNWVDYGEDLMRDTQAIRKYNEIANAMGTRTTLADQAAVDGFEINLGGGAVMTAYAANGFVRGGSAQIPRVTTPNERSLSFLVTFGEFDFLVSGDLIGRDSGSEDAEVEQAVAEAIVEDDRVVEVLHVNHHGADNASASAFVELLQPNIAIISAGNGNGHRHPRNRALRRLYEGNVYRTILTSFGTSREKIASNVRNRMAVYQNDIVIRSDGDDYEVSTSRAFHSNVNCVLDSRCSARARVQ